MKTPTRTNVPSVPLPAATPQTNDAFLKLLSAVETHALIAFRHFPAADREEAVAESVAGAFVNFVSAARRGKLHVVTPATLARYGVLHTKCGSHVGGSLDGAKDVMSPRAQRRGGFRIVRLPWDDPRAYHCLKAPDQHVWRLAMMHDRRTPPPEQAAFRIDWSSFMSRQSDRTRTALAMLAAGHKQTEVADKLGVTPAAVCQRMSRARREWAVFQGTNCEETSAPNQQA